MLVTSAALLSCGSEENSTDTAKDSWSVEDRQTLLRGFNGSRIDLLEAVNGLSDEQWNFKADSNSWSIAYIVEHLGLQEDMHFREVYVISLAPPHDEFAGDTRKNDEKVTSYETNPIKTESAWFVTPLGRWQTKEDALFQFNSSRDKMIEFVESTQLDLRKYVTFRNIPDETDFRRIRDLHQILLTTIAHTRRHIRQIEGIKSLPNFPD